MPNWVKTIAHAIKDDADLTKFGSQDEKFSFENIIPMPESIYRGDLGMEERQKYRSNNWYDWSIANWGTKWDACESRVSEKTIVFETAWSFARPVMKELAKKVGGLLCFYADEDIGSNCGFVYINDKGEAEELDSNIVFAECVWGGLDLEDRDECLQRFEYLIE